VEVQTLADTGKMIKLKNILKEIEVGLPLSKKEILNWWFNKGNIYLLSYLNHSPSLNQFLSDNGYDNLEDYLEDEFGFEENVIPEIIEYVEAYYKIFKSNEIFVTTFGDRYGTFTKGTSYKNIEIEYIGDDQYYLYCNNY
jgi:hypothetical protein